eukprot:scaffold232727_cov68-Attheya_sp.AAC.3
MVRCLFFFPIQSKLPVSSLGHYLNGVRRLLVYCMCRRRFFCRAYGAGCVVYLPLAYSRVERVQSCGQSLVACAT